MLIRENDGTGGSCLILPEEIRIGNTTQFKKEILNALDSSSHISIDGSKVTRIDTAAIQLLTALAHDCNEKGHPIKWKGASEELENYVKLLGLHESLGLNRQ